MFVCLFCLLLFILYFVPEKQRNLHYEKLLNRKQEKLWGFFSLKVRKQIHPFALFGHAEACPSGACYSWCKSATYWIFLESAASVVSVRSGHLSRAKLSEISSLEAEDQLRASDIQLTDQCFPKQKLSV